MQLLLALLWAGPPVRGETLEGGTHKPQSPCTCTAPQTYLWEAGRGRVTGTDVAEVFGTSSQCRGPCGRDRICERQQWEEVELVMREKRPEGQRLEGGVQAV